MSAVTATPSPTRRCGGTRASRTRPTRPSSPRSGGTPVTKLTPTKASIDDVLKVASRVALRKMSSAPHASEMIENVRRNVTDRRTSTGNGYISHANRPASGRRIATEPTNTTPHTNVVSTGWCEVGAGIPGHESDRGLHGDDHQCQPREQARSIVPALVLPRGGGHDGRRDDRDDEPADLVGGVEGECRTERVASETWSGAGEDRSYGERDALGLRNQQRVRHGSICEFSHDRPRSRVHARAGAAGGGTRPSSTSSSRTLRNESRVSRCEESHARTYRR